MLEGKLRGLEALGKILLDGVANDALTGKSDERSGLGKNHVAEHGKRCRNAPGGRIGEHGDVEQSRSVMAFHGTRGLGHLHERGQALLHAGATRRAEDDDRQPFIGGAVEQTAHLLAHDRPHRAHEKLGLHETEGHGQITEHALASTNGLVLAGFLAIRCDLLGIAGKLERIDILDIGIPLLEGSLVHDKLDTLVGREARERAARGAGVIVFDEFGIVKGELACMAGAPLRGLRRICMVRGHAFHPVLESRIDIERLEHTQASIGRTLQETIVLGKRERIGTEQDALHLGILGCLENGICVGEQLARGFVAQLDGRVCETRVAIEAPIARQGHDARNAGAVDGAMRLLGWLALHHDQGGRTVHGKAIVPIHGAGHMKQSLLVHLRGNFEGDAIETIHDIDTRIHFGFTSLFFHVNTPLAAAIRVTRR